MIIVTNVETSVEKRVCAHCGSAGRRFWMVLTPDGYFHMECFKVRYERERDDE